MLSDLMLLSLTIFSLLFSLLRTTKEMSSATAKCNDVDVDVDCYSILARPDDTSSLFVLTSFLFCDNDCYSILFVLVGELTEIYDVCRFFVPRLESCKLPDDTKNDFCVNFGK